ncbi:hypothetical protein SLA2020_309590 [Shorea laevis]
MEAPKGLPVFLLAFLILILIQSAVGQHVSLSSAGERRALLDLRSSLALRGKDWPVKAHPCLSWTGVHCENGRVTRISVSGLKRTRLGRLNPSFNVDSLANFSTLVSFNASGFSLPGLIPEWFGSSLSALQVLDLRSCRVYGPIPASLGNLSKLHSLYLSDNSLAGSIPAALGQLMELEILDLSSNSLTGLIPSSFSSLRNITRLQLASNFLSGSIPPSLGSLSSLQVLNLSDNNLAASIPSQLGNLSRLFEIDLSKNSLSGSLPQEFKGLRGLQKMMIGDNELEGIFPGGLFSSLVELQVVDLSGNKLDGALPDILWSMPKLQFLDVSGNNLTGELTSLASRSNVTAAAFNLSHNLLYGSLNFQFKTFKFIDLSGNYFQGVVSDDNGRNATLDRNCLRGIPSQRSLDNCRLFYTQRGLSFDNFGAPDASQAPLVEQNPESKKRWIFILAGVLGGLGFIAILIALLVLLLRRCNRRVTNQIGNPHVGSVPEGDSPQLAKEPSISSGPGQPFTYQQLLQATDGFSEMYLIKHGHSGDIFQGTLEDGSTIVIKKVSLPSVKKESYPAQLELFGKLLHARFVPILGYCLEHKNDKFFVYKYMPNGDLATSFYRATNSEDDNMQSLDWITRLKIAMGAAEGLSYLHHECNPPLVHRDVQASSILLDNKFEVRLGSLSEVCVQEGDSHKNVLTRFLRKPQTSEPGPSGQSSANCAYDVYCFGKVLLELITGKLGISRTDDASTREWLEQTLACISIYDKELVTKIVDPSLIVDEDLLEEVWAMAIVARSCLNPKPSKRPPMKYVLKALENPLKVVRDESFSSARLRTTSSRRSWSAALFGSWRQSSSESATVPGHPNREGLGGLKQSGRIGSQGSGGNEHSSSHKRLSNEIFPEPLDEQEM